MECGFASTTLHGTWLCMRDRDLGEEGIDDAATTDCSLHIAFSSGACFVRKVLLATCFPVGGKRYSQHMHCEMTGLIGGPTKNTSFEGHVNINFNERRVYTV